MPERESSSHGPETTVGTMPVSASNPDTVSASTSSGVSQHITPSQLPTRDSSLHQLHKHHLSHSSTWRSRSHTLESAASSTATSSHWSERSTSHSHLATATTTPGLNNQPFPPFVSSPIKRKPLSTTASSLAIALQSPTIELPKPDTRFSRSPSVESPTLYELPTSEDPTAFQSFEIDLETIPPPASNLGSIPSQSHLDTSSSVHVGDELSDVLSDYDRVALDSTPDASPIVLSHPALDLPHPYGQEPLIHNLNTPMLSSKAPPPILELNNVNTSPPKASSPNDQQPPSPSTIKRTSSPRLNKPLPKSPNHNAALANIIGWGDASPSAATDFSSLPSPSTPTRGGRFEDSPFNRDQKSDVSAVNALGYCESYLSTPPPQAAASSNQVTEMEDELKAISSELAASIRREMDLEDLVDRLQDQVSNPQAPSKRTSDYFSDSGYSSAKVSDYDQSREEVEKIQRRSEQEKATLRLELTNKLQDERSKRQALDEQVKQLAERASQVDLAQMNNLDANGRLKELETTCDDLRRKLSEERESKTNFEDLLTALKGELQSACNERDNLKDEIVPQLRARVEGLEAEATSHAHLTYESTKMQHQLQSLQQENTSLRNSTAGLDELMRRPGAGLSRSDSTFRGQAPPNSKTDNKSESREALAERLKDVEAQRDALHNALRNLLERQEFQTRENQKKIKILETERQRLLTDSPKKAGFEKDISKLRTEINVLRRRAEEALEQKWQVEKGLGGLKMDLDRAEEEITTLRGLLKDNDILLAPSASSPGGKGANVTSASLQAAYDDLQSQYNESLERIKKLEESTGSGQDEKTKQALQRLEQSLNSALLERNAARVDVDGLQSQYDSLATSASKNVDSERALADELSESATRVEQLAAQVRSQLSTNAELRQRLSDAVTRGESDRKINSERIAGLQERLRGLEDQLVNAQTSSEDHISRHEEEISKLKDAHNEQLRRLNNGGSVGMSGPKKDSILNGANGVFGRAPQNIPSKSFEQESEVKKLREHVAQLEKALADTENEMQEVVNKMSTAQIEVMNLQEEREAAIHETRRLQGMVKQEASSPFSSQLRMLGMAA